MGCGGAEGRVSFPAVQGLHVQVWPQYHLSATTGPTAWLLSHLLPGHIRLQAHPSELNAHTGTALLPRGTSLLPLLLPRAFLTHPAHGHAESRAARDC